ncbi:MULTISPECIES: M1 family aminopeptidase [unclassified Fusibacter]|uniref:M1 family aminopeptidase n=1 Tax=unclassified Fusibacter TaxID=2624464 RepID=UPI001010F28F|nr:MULTISPECIES: M1 family aminopeptidase [unclassified Fusibacter]MCK8059712.1 hypothetical protein [Fusibacter sp. A2]NPE21513.1 hypothetical protein [Fusibacter sp. A1]RXV61923.1 hypothetical protein DWB64_06700 [Fusibacter sp. A1]
MKFTDKSYQLVSPFDTYEDGVWKARITSPFPTQTFMASDRFDQQSYSVTSGNTTIDVYYLDEKNKKSTELLSNQTQHVLDFFKSKFGSIDSQHESIVVVPRGNGTSGGGYNRPGLVILPDIDAISEDNHPKYAPDIYAFKYLSHEIAHKWWSKASTISWQDWLNESFAEYSCLLAVEAFIGKERFDQLIDLYVDITKDLPAIWGIDRNHEQAFDVLYTKGALKLHNLRLKIGVEAFYRFLSQLHEQKIADTDDLLKQLSITTDQATRDWFEATLKK